MSLGILPSLLCAYVDKRLFSSRPGLEGGKEADIKEKVTL